MAALVAGELDDRALGGEVAAQDREPAGRLERVAQGADHLLPGRLAGGGGDLADRLAGDGRGILVQKPRLRQALREQRDAAGAVEVDGDEAPARLEVAQQRRARADLVEVVDVELDAGLAREREQVQHAVGRAAARCDRGDRVLDAPRG